MEPSELEEGEAAIVDELRGPASEVLYLAGPMSDTDENTYEDFNRPAFHKEAARLRDLGYTVISPAEMPGIDPDKPYTVGDEQYRAILKRDVIIMLSTADRVAMLDGWEDSEGACTEVEIASMLYIPCIDAKELTEVCIKEERTDDGVYRD